MTCAIVNDACCPRDDPRGTDRNDRRLELETLGDMNPAAVSDALALLRRAVEKIETERLGLHINVGAELFPKLSDDREQAAAFYTQPAPWPWAGSTTCTPCRWPCPCPCRRSGRSTT